MRNFLRNSCLTVALIMCLVVPAGIAFYEERADNVMSYASENFTADTKTQYVSADESAVFIGLNERYTVQAAADTVTIPYARVFDEIDIDLSYTVSAQYCGVPAPVSGDKLTLEGLGEYELTYTAVNGRGVKTEKKAILEVQDNLPPLLSYDCKFLEARSGEICMIPSIGIEDYYPTEQEVYLVGTGGEILLENRFTMDENCLKLKYIVTEISDNALSSVYELPLKVLGSRDIYAFDDIGEEGGVSWNGYQSDLSSFDPTIYQVPSVSQNTDKTYDYDGDGKSMKVTVNGKQGCNAQNSWPAVVTWDIDLGFIDRYETLSFMVFNASENDMTIMLQMNFSVNATFSAEHGEWTKIIAPLSVIRTKYGASTLTSIKIFINGFESGSVVYYLDKMTLE